MKIKHYLHAIIMALIFLGALSAYAGWYAMVERESTSAVSLAGQIQAKTETVSRAQAAKTQLTRALSDQAAITGYFVNTNDIVPFLETLQITGAKYGAKVQVESVSAQAAEPHALLQLAVRITGSFDAVERTLGAIEYEPYDTRVQNVTLDTAGAGDKVPQWTAAVTMNVGTIDATTTSAAAKEPAASTSATTTP